KQLFLFGGDISNKEFPDFIEYLDLEDMKHWVEIKFPPLSFNVNLLGFGVLSKENKHYLIGGSIDCNVECFSHIIEFNPNENSFNLIDKELNITEYFLQDRIFHQIEEGEYCQFGNRTRELIKIKI